MAFDHNVKAILFDLDGVLVDACEVHRVALNQALEEVGYTITEEEHYDRYNGRPTRVKLRMLTEEKGLPLELHDQVMNRKQQLTLEMIPKVIRPDKGTCRLLKVLTDLNISIACCSNAVRASVVALLDVAQLLPFIKVIVGNDEGVAPKPAPDVFLAGAARLGVDIKSCVIVEDSSIGVQAAMAANARKVVVVKDPSYVNLDLLKNIVGDGK